MWAEVAARFGLAGQVHALPGERTVNGLLCARDGDPVAVLKLHDPADADDIRLEIAALQRLASFTELAGRVPEVLPATDGAPVVEIGTPDGARLARALSWVPGRTWRVATPGPRALPGLGRLVAQVDAALAGFDHPHAGRTLRWNLVRAADALALVDHLDDPAQREATRTVLERFVHAVEPALAAMPTQVIHGDANDANIVVDDLGEARALIDFGDLCRAPRICGLAIACAYAVSEVPVSRHPVGGLLPLVAGYREVRPLDGRELALLVPLIRTRLAVSLALGAWQHAAQPGNAYLLSSREAVWSALQRLG